MTFHFVHDPAFGYVSALAMLQLEISLSYFSLLVSQIFSHVYERLQIHGKPTQAIAILSCCLLLGKGPKN